MANHEIIEEEYRMKLKYENLLSDLVTFIYYRFLTSDQKYSQSGLPIKHNKSLKRVLKKNIFFSFFNLSIHDQNNSCENPYFYIN
jgi:hypothetical protein